MGPTLRVTWRALFGTVLSIYFALGIFYSVSKPPWESPDEPAHFAYVRYLATQHTLPVRTAKVGDEFYQPPLFYVVGALLTSGIDTSDFGRVKLNPKFIWSPLRQGSDINAVIHTMNEGFPYHGSVFALHLLRLLSVALGGVVVWATYQLAREAFPDRNALAIGAAASIAFTPQYLFVMASVSNDAAVAAFSSLAILWLVRIARAGGRRRDFVLLSLWNGLALLSKLNALAILATTAVTLAFLAWRRGRANLLGGAIACGTTLAVAAWWFLRNLLFYSSPLAGQTYMSDATFAQMYAQSSVLTQLILRFPYPLFTSFWGNFGWQTIPLAPWMYQVAVVFVAAAIVGLISFGADRIRQPRRRGSVDAISLVICLFTEGSVAALVFAHYLTTFGNFFPQGRYLFPGMSAIGLLLAVGWAELLQGKARDILPLLVGLILLCLSIYVPIAFIAPKY